MSSSYICIKLLFILFIEIPFLIVLFYYKIFITIFVLVICKFTTSCLGILEDELLVVELKHRKIIQVNEIKTKSLI